MRARLLAPSGLAIFLCACVTTPSPPPGEGSDGPSAAFIELKRPLEEARPARITTADGGVLSLSPAEMLRRLEASAVEYRITELEDGDLETIPDRLWPRRWKPLTLPRVVRGADGGVAVEDHHERPEVEAILQRAEPSYQARDFAAAAAAYEEALRLDPGSYTSWLHYGDTALFSGDPHTALERYGKAIALRPLDHRGHFYAANALAAIDWFESALDEYAWALTLRPRHPPLREGISARQARGRFRFWADLLRPEAVAVRHDGGVEIRTEPEPHWLAYGVCKGLWLGEPSHRAARLGKPESAPHDFTATEELECVGALLTTYEQAKRDGKALEDPYLEKLAEVLRAGYGAEWAVFELGSRVMPHVTLVLPEETRQRIFELVRNHLLERHRRRR